MFSHPQICFPCSWLLLLAFRKPLGFSVQKNHSFILILLEITDGEINLNQLNCKVVSLENKKCKAGKDTQNKMGDSKKPQTIMQKITNSEKKQIFKTKTKEITHLNQNHDT